MVDLVDNPAEAKIADLQEVQIGCAIGLQVGRGPKMKEFLVDPESQPCRKVFVAFCGSNMFPIIWEQASIFFLRAYMLVFRGRGGVI